MARSICVGKDLAQRSLFINIATILWGADIANFTDGQGVVVVPSQSALADDGAVVYVSSLRLLQLGITDTVDCRRPVAFPLSIRPRSADVQSVVEAMIEEV